MSSSICPSNGVGELDARRRAEAQVQEADMVPVVSTGSSPAYVMVVPSSSTLPESGPVGDRTMVAYDPSVTRVSNPPALPSTTPSRRPRTEDEAAELAAALPRPGAWHPGVTSRAYRRYVEVIRRRMDRAEFLRTAF
jgi:hypothetical protein